MSPSDLHCHQLRPYLRHLSRSLVVDIRDHPYMVLGVVVVRKDLAHKLLDQECMAAVAVAGCCIRTVIWMVKSLLKQMGLVGDMLVVRLLRSQEEADIATESDLVAVDNHHLD